MRHKKIQMLFLMVLISLTFISCNKVVVVKSGDLQIEFDQKMYSRVNSLSDKTNLFNKSFQLTEFLETKKNCTSNFSVEQTSTTDIIDKMGQGEQTIIKGKSLINGTCLTKLVTVKTYNEFPGLAIFDVSYVNCGEKDLIVNKWTNNQYGISSMGDTTRFWSFQGSSTSVRADWVLPVGKGFYQKNFMGMNQSDYGGGIPVTDIWRRDGGLAVGHLELVPKEVSLPVDYDKYSDYAQIGVEFHYKDPVVLMPGDTLNTFQTFVSVHTGDYFSALQMYSEVMQKKGISFAEAEPDAFESIWCGWGYERKFTAENIIQTLPKVKELGIKWVVIDDGYQIAEGDWRVDTERFPGGTKNMKKMVDAIHGMGLKAKLWWSPLAADPGSKVLIDNPNILLINKDGAPQFITWWNSYYLSPAAEETFTYTRETVEMILKDWGFDGLKMDGQHMNAVPADYNRKRLIEYPEKSIEMLPELFEMIYKTAREIKPNAVVENCPCGTCMSFYNMPFTNQTVSSDPTGSWQIRLKGKTYKAIMPHTAYYGDHVELSDNGTDFASSFGVGAVLGTKFTWPADNPNQSQSFLLTSEKEVLWKKWFGLYNEKMLSKEKYLGELYDIGFDKPETHVIQKGDTLFYAFFNKQWNGNIELRGLKRGENYIAHDYVNNLQIAKFSGDNPVLNAEFDNFLFIAVYQDKKY